jgi:hypothetical protein
MAGIKWFSLRLIGKVFVLFGLDGRARNGAAVCPAGIPVALATPSPLLNLGNGRATMKAQQPLDDVLQRVQGEYREMPGLRLTTAQAQRLWGLDRAACDALLGALVDAKFLFRTRDGAFMRSDQARAART